MRKTTVAKKKNKNIRGKKWLATTTKGGREKK